MSNCPGCDNSSTTYTRCNPPQSSNCTFYQGESLTCSSDATFKVCKGDNLTDIQKVIFDKVCKLAGDINIESIEFPCSLQDAWEKQDPTILNLLQYVVNIQCEQQKFISDLDLQNINPFVKVCLACCTPGCTTNTPVVLLLSEALAAIVSCVCTAKAEAANALSIANNALSKSTTALNNYSDLVNQNCILRNQINYIFSTIVPALTPSGSGFVFQLPTTC